MIPPRSLPRADADVAPELLAAVVDADAMVLRGNGAVSTGTDPGIAVARTQLPATARRTNAAAHHPVPLDECACPGQDFVDAHLASLLPGPRDRPTRPGIACGTWPIG